jgi:predicted Zn-dependent protease
MPLGLLLFIAGLLLAPSVPAQENALALESRRAKELMGAGRFADAIPIYEKLVQAMPANPGLRLNLAMSLHLAGQDAKAIPQFESVLRQQPTALPALMLLGASYLRTGSPAKAVPVLEKALTLAPGDVEGRSMLADALLMLDRYQAAVPHLRKLAAAQPDNPRAWYGLGRSYEAVAQSAFAALEKSGQDSPWWLALAAEARLKQGRHTAAFTLYRAALDKQPALRGVHAGLAEVYRKTGHADWAAGEEERERKLGAPACSAPSPTCHFVQGRFEQALAATRALKTPEAFYWRSRAANELARDAFARLAKLPPSVEFHQMMAELHRNNGRHADSIEQWKAALALAPGDPRLEQELATSIYMSRDYAAAEKMARELLAKDPRVPELQFILGDSLAGQQQLEAALEPLRKAIALRLDYPAAHAVLGRALMQLGQTAEAAPHLKAALPIDTDGSLHFQLSRAYQDSGKPAQAAAMLEKYQEIRKTTETGEVAITAPR